MVLAQICFYLIRAGLKGYNFFPRFFLLILVITLPVFSGCEKDVVNVTDNSGFDSARYTWQTDTLNDIYYSDGWYHDSSLIFLNGGYCMTKFDGTNYDPYYVPGSFGIYCISGIDENNVYLGGSHLEPNNTYKARLKKWTGSSFEDLFLTDSSDNSEYFTSISARSNNEVWLSTENGNVYKFDGVNFQKFPFDTSGSTFSYFLKDENNNFCYARKIYYGVSSVDSALTEIYRYNGFSWNRIYRKMLYGGGTYFFFQNVGNEIFGVGDNVLYKFNGSDFVTVLTVGNAFLMLNGEVSGQNLNSIMCKGYDFSARKDCIYHWNGQKWSKEMTMDDNVYTKFIYTDEHHCFIIIYKFLSYTSYMLKGNR